MGEPYYADDQVTLWHGDSLEVLSALPDASVDCCVTSPPYFGLRDYGEEGQYGLEASPAEYVETMRRVFAEVRRVLADDGTLWLNLGDSYYSGRGAATGVDQKNPARRGFGRVLDKGGCDWARPKNLLGIPWRTAFALQDDGWNLRNDVIWAKRNAMPGPEKDRLTCRHEHLFMFSKSRRYWFDLDPVREPHLSADDPRNRADRTPERTRDVGGRDDGFTRTSGAASWHPLGKNPGDVWTMAASPFPEAHFATMPVALAERAVLAGCKPGGMVLDPFSGTGTTGLAATKHGRRYVGIDLSRDYLDLSLRTRFAQPGFDFAAPVPVVGEAL